MKTTDFRRFVYIDISGSMPSRDICTTLKAVRTMSEKEAITIVPFSSKVGPWFTLNPKLGRADFSDTLEKIDKYCKHQRTGTCTRELKQDLDRLGKQDLAIIVTDGLLQDDDLLLEFDTKQVGLLYIMGESTVYDLVAAQRDRLWANGFQADSIDMYGASPAGKWDPAGDDYCRDVLRKLDHLFTGLMLHTGKPQQAAELTYDSDTSDDSPFKTTLSPAEKRKKIEELVKKRERLVQSSCETARLIRLLREEADEEEQLKEQLEPFGWSFEETT